MFYDPAQSLRLAEDTDYPDLGKPYELKFNCRNTREIALRCGRIRGVEILVRPASPRGNPPKRVHAAGKEQQIRACSRQLDEWSGQGGLKRSQIALMCMARPSASNLRSLTNLGNHPLVGTHEMGSREQSPKPGFTSIEWRSGEAILVTSIRRFRGLEADAVIIFDLPAPSRPKTFRLGI